VAKRQAPPELVIDMTPMIDMTFQLIAFFMILIKFSDADQDQSVQLPASELAKAPDAPAKFPLTLNVDKSGAIICGGQKYDTAEAIKPLLNNERYVLENKQVSASSATVIIRAHQDAATGIVQATIKVCQEVGFEKFVLRAKEKT
jgi:biopolymer transport protein ExbD